MGIFSWRNKRIEEKALPEEEEMSFLDHLEELRWHLIRAAIPIVVVAVVLFSYRMEVMGTVFMGPFRGDFPTFKLLCKITEAFCFEKIPIIVQSLSPQEQFMKAMVYSFFGGFLISFPYIIWEMWRFIKPGLHAKEVKAVRWNVFFISFLFFSGVAFGYFVLLPISIKFFSSFELAPGVSNNWRIGEIVSFTMMIMLGTGVLFQLPVTVYYLSKLGFITPVFLQTYRKHAIVVILILAAFITPPDPLTQILIAIPLTALYELSIFVSRKVQRQKIKEEKEFENTRVK